MHDSISIWIHKITKTFKLRIQQQTQAFINLNLSFPSNNNSKIMKTVPILMIITNNSLIWWQVLVVHLANTANDKVRKIWLFKTHVK